MYKKDKFLLCPDWINDGHCPTKSQCRYAHSSSELKDRVQNISFYKSVICRDYLENEGCDFGDNCLFLHSSEPPELDSAYTTFKELENPKVRIEKLAGQLIAQLNKKS